MVRPCLEGVSHCLGVETLDKLEMRIPTLGTTCSLRLVVPLSTEGLQVSDQLTGGNW